MKVNGKENFVVSNLSKTDLQNRNSVSSNTAVLYGGLGGTELIELSGARKDVPIEPVGVIVLGIDGLRQDVLYAPSEQQVNDPPNGEYYVQPENLKGFCHILGGKGGLLSCDAAGWEKRHVKLQKVTAIFPSITLASWASIFTGMMPGTTYDSSGNNVGGTGILGNEFFARDLYGQGIGAPRYLENGFFQRKYNPAGVISFSSGAFRGYDQYGHWEKLTDNSFFVPYQGDWNVPISPVRTETEQGTPQNDPAILIPRTVFESIASQPGIKRYFKEKGGDPVVVANNHYARGAYWLTWDLNLIASSSGEVLDRQSWDKFDDYLSGKYKTSPGSTGLRNEIPFSALTIWYLPGLDHQAHVSGMSNYKNYFINNTDVFIDKVVDRLKELDELNNKIFIIVADHGMTAMPLPEQMTLNEKDENGNVIKTWYGDASCKLNDEGFGKKKVQMPEQANNNLHIWELGEMFKAIGKKGWGQYKVLAPKEIAELYLIKDKTTNKIIELPYGATAKVEKADVIVGLNGPMAHVYLTDIDKLGKIAELFRLALDDHPTEAAQWWNIDDLDYSDFKINTIGKLKASVDKILVRVSGNYCVFDGLNDDGSVRCSVTDPFTVSAYVDAWTRINGMNHKDRSGDIVLIMRDATAGNAVDRYTTGVACKSWHGSLSPSDSYVPFIVSYPGGNKTELKKILQKDTLCKTDYSNCKGNWKLSDVVKEIISEQYK